MLSSDISGCTLDVLLTRTLSDLKSSAETQVPLGSLFVPEALTSCLRDIPRPIPSWNLALLREKYPEHRPPLSREIVDGWSVTHPLPPLLYEYLTEFSDTIYDASTENKTTVESPTDNSMLLDNYIHDPIFLNLKTGKVVKYYYNEDNPDSPTFERRVAESFEEYIMKQFQSPAPSCRCPKCQREKAATYNILRIMSGMSGLPFSL